MWGLLQTRSSTRASTSWKRFLRSWTRLNCFRIDHRDDRRNARSSLLTSDVYPISASKSYRMHRVAVGIRSCPGTAWDLPAPSQAGSQRTPVRSDGCIARGKPVDFCPDHRASVLPRLFHRLGYRNRSIIPHRHVLRKFCRHAFHAWSPPRNIQLA
jgi:hypothetical protein